VQAVAPPSLSACPQGGRPALARRGRRTEDGARGPSVGIRAQRVRIWLYGV